MIFITGTTGLLGSHLLGYLLKCRQNENIYALKRKNSCLENTRAVVRQYTTSEEDWASVHWVEGDVLEERTLEPWISRVNYVYHCAAVVSFDGEDRGRLLDINLKGTENVARLCNKYKVRLCYVSSIAALGDAGYEGEIVDEETPMIMETIRSVYSQSKIASENIVWKYVRKGLNVVIVNPSIILGAGHWQQSSSRLFVTVSKGMPFYTEGVCGYADVRDVCKAMVRLAEDASIRGERFVVNGGNYSYKELFTTIARVTGQHPPFFPMRPWMTELAWRALAVWGKISGKKPAFTCETARSSQHRSYYSSHKLLGLYADFAFFPLEDTLRYLHRIYQEENRETTGPVG